METTSRQVERFNGKSVLVTGAASGIGRATALQLAEPSDVVAAILFLASDEARFVTGAELLVDGGYVL